MDGRFEDYLTPTRLFERICYINSKVKRMRPCWSTVPALSLVVALTAVTQVGCRSKLEAVRVNPNGAVSQAIPLEDGAIGNRLYFQSNSVIALSLSATQVKKGDQFNLVNETTGQTLIDEQALGLTDSQSDPEQQGFSLTDGGGYDITVRIYPNSEVNSNKLVYGDNQLRFNINGNDGPRYLERVVVLRDFPMFGSGGLRANEEDSTGGGLRGWFTGIVRPIVRGEDADGNGYVLRTGFFHSVYH